MKVDMKNLPDEKQKPKFGRKQADKEPAKKLFGRKKQDDEPDQDLPEEEDAVEEDVAEDDAAEDSTPAGSTGNVYRDNFYMYKEQYSKKLKNANLLQSNKFWIVIIVILFFVFLSVNSNASRTRNQLTVKLNRTTNEYENLTAAVTDLKAELEEQARIESVVLTNEEEELARSDAKVQGAAVATLQNKFATASTKLTEINQQIEEASDDSEKQAKIVGEQKALIEEQKTIKQDLQPYFSDDSKRVGPGAWYKYLATGIPGTWEFASNASFKGDTMKVLWFLYADDPENPKDHSLLAYCTAVYNASDGLFHNVEVMTTTYADANYAKYSNEEEYVPDGSELSIMEQLQQLAEEGGSNTPPAGEEYVNDAISGRDEYKDKVLNGEVEDEEFDENYLPGLNTDEESEESEDNDNERSE